MVELLLQYPDAPPNFKSAAIQVLARVPQRRWLPAESDRLGRPAVAIEFKYPDSESAARRQELQVKRDRGEHVEYLEPFLSYTFTTLYFDVDSGSLLEVRDRSDDGSFALSEVVMATEDMR